MEVAIVGLGLLISGMVGYCCYGGWIFFMCKDDSDWEVDEPINESDLSQQSHSYKNVPPSSLPYSSPTVMRLCKEKRPSGMPCKQCGSCGED